MSYKGTVQRNVRKAFLLLKDLTREVILSKSVVGDFDFSVGTPIVGANSTLVVKAVMVDVKKKSGAKEQATSVEKSFIMNAEDIPDIGGYDRITDGAVVWNIVPPYVNDGYTATVNVVRST